MNEESPAFRRGSVNTCCSMPRPAPVATAFDSVDEVHSQSANLWWDDASGLVALTDVDAWSTWVTGPDRVLDHLSQQAEA